MKLFRVKIEHECFLLAENEQDANEKFWEMRDDINVSLDNFIDDITTTEEIEEAQELE